MQKYLIVFPLLFSFSVFGKGTKNVVFWLSIDGFNPSYLEKARTPRLDSIMKRSVYTTKLVPIFPSITFPGHCSQATGVRVKEHGIPLNTFYDTATAQMESYPADSSLLQAEPLWQTVKRGGLRSAVFDWPLSYKQTGKFKSDYFYDSYESSLSDEQRVERALAVWEKDRSAGQTLNLIMAYIEGPDSVGHKLGPKSTKVFEVVESVDLLVGKIQDKIKEIASADTDKGTRYFLLLTTDHGMTEVKVGVNFNLLTNVSLDSKIKLLPGGGIGHIFLSGVSPKEHVLMARKLMAEVSKHSFAKIYTRRELPEKWQYDHPTRVGDLVVVLEPGYAFVNNANRVSVPISEAGGPMGMHGYDPEVSPDMYGIMVLWRYPEVGTPVEINSPVSSLVLHSTVARLLGVPSSSQTHEKPLKELKHIFP